MGEKGIIKVAFLIILLIGVAIGVILAGQTQIFEPKASQKSSSRAKNPMQNEPLLVYFKAPKTEMQNEEKITIAFNNLEAKKDVIAAYYGFSNKKIPSGIVVDDRPGKSPFDKKWSFHLDPDSIKMAQFTIELCDARPSYVEENLDEWLSTVKRYCPWSLNIEKIKNIPKPIKSKKDQCPQVITNACLSKDPTICLDFPTPCDIPKGWVK